MEVYRMKNRKRTAALLTAGLLVLGMGATVGMTANAAGSITVEYAADGDNAHGKVWNASAGIRRMVSRCIFHLPEHYPAPLYENIIFFFTGRRSSISI